MRTAAVIGSLLLLGATALAADGRGYKVIVHPDNPRESLERSFLSSAFLKRTTRWPDGEPIRPVDGHPASAARERFSADVHGRSTSAVRLFWQQALFAGRELPPPELGSGGEVVEYVLRHRGAVGYVAPETDTRTARVVGVR